MLCLGYPDSGEDLVALFKRKGARTVDCVDVIAHKGFERIADLNVAQEWPHLYTLIFNPGTLEHCFNIGQAWVNAWSALAVNGHSVHALPLSLLNHGFWNINPIALTDWCASNGGTVLSVQYAINGTQAFVCREAIKDSPSGRGKFPAETVMYALLRKDSEVPLRWPVQGVYRR